MIERLISSCILLSFSCFPTFAQVATDSPTTAPTTAPMVPDEFNDPETGARIIRLSRHTDEPSGVIYFHQPCITADGKYTLVRTLSPKDGHTAGFMYRFDFQSKQIEKLTDRVTRNQVLAPKSGNLYYSSDEGRAIYVTNIYSKETRKLADMPSELLCAGGVTVNCDESLVVGTAGLASAAATQPALNGPPNQNGNMGTVFDRRELNILFSIDTVAGKYKELHRINTWLGHTQFSPTDPKLLMYCHEGPWGKVDRIWNIKIEDGAQPWCVYKREDPKEIAGHEFWSADGKTVWFDNNYRDNVRHFLKGKNIETGEITAYPITREFGSIHYTPSPDGKFLIADGGTRADPKEQAMFILVPKDGQLKPVKLCSMEKNNYKAAEPNPHITPDQRWVVFTATLSGKPQAWAVETPKEFWMK